MDKKQAKNFFRSLAKQIKEAKPGTAIRVSTSKADQRIEALNKPAGKQENKELKKR